MAYPIFRTRLTGGRLGTKPQLKIQGMRLRNAEARAILAAALEALRADPDSSLFTDVWESGNDKMPFNINLTVLPGAGADEGLSDEVPF